MDRFSENFHHTQPVEFYDDVNLGSFYSQEKDSQTAIGVIGQAATDFNPESYAKMIIPKSFDGKADPRLWIKHYEVIAEANLWDDEMKVRRIIASLDGAAQQWFMNQRLTKPNITWKVLKDGLVNRFSKSIEGLTIIDTDRLTLRRTEDFDKYWEEKLGRLKSMSPNIPQKELMQKLFDGHNKELKSKVLSKIVDRRSKTADELYKLIKEIIDIEEYKKAMENNNNKKSEKYHRNQELTTNSYYLGDLQYENCKRKMAKIKEDIKEIKSFILDDLIEEKSDDTMSVQEEINHTGAEVNHGNDENANYDECDENSESSGSEDGANIAEIFDENEDIN